MGLNQITGDMDSGYDNLMYLLLRIDSIKNERSTERIMLIQELASTEASSSMNMWQRQRYLARKAEVLGRTEVSAASSESSGTSSTSSVPLGFGWPMIGLLAVGAFFVIRQR